jgi:hypothetical protein
MEQEMKKLIILAAVIFLFSNSVCAELASDKTITTFGLEDGEAKGYFSVAEPLAASTPCQYNVVFFTGKGFLAGLLAAKISGKRIKLLNYTYNPTTTVCTLVGFVIE